MKLEIGKEYVTRSGLKVKIYDIAGNENYPVIAGVVEDNTVTPYTYTKEGKFTSGHIHNKDIIGEWQEPLDFDWSCLPAWCNKYIAMDSNGKWFSFNCVPFKNVGGWSSKDFYVRIPQEFAPKNFKGDWENSLFKNPNLPCNSPQTKE